MADWEGYADDRELLGQLEAFYYKDILNKKLILDAACGDGALLEPLKKSGSQFEKIIGLDISFKRLERCRGRVNNAQFIQASITDLPFKANTFDAVAAIYVFEHLPNNQTHKMCNELNRVLSKEGCLVLAVPNKWSYRISYTLGSLFKKTPPPDYTHINMMTFKQYKQCLERVFHIKDVKIVGLPYIRILSKLGLGRVISRMWKRWAVGFCFILEKAEGEIQ